MIETVLVTVLVNVIGILAMAWLLVFLLDLGREIRRARGPRTPVRREGSHDLPWS